MLYTMQVVTDNRHSNEAHYLFLNERMPSTDEHAALYGSYDPDTSNLNAVSSQRENFSFKLAEYCMQCLDLIMSEQGRHVVDYAVWYTERIMENDACDFDRFVQEQVCRFIVREHFISETASFTVTNFVSE